MKTSDNNNYTAPSYPTLAQVRALEKHSRIPKIAAATAIVASMGLFAGCGDNTENLAAKKLFKKELKRTKNALETEDYTLAGDVEVLDPTEDTDWQVDGDVAAPDPTDDTDWQLNGEEAAPDPTDDTEWVTEGEAVPPDMTDETDDFAVIADITDMSTEYRIEGGVPCEIPEG